MEIQELQTYCDEFIKKLEKHYGLESDKEKDRWAYALKLGEEVGELFDVILKLKGYQRDIKLNGNNTELEDELADVLLTTIILARSFKIDVDKILQSKMDKINSRGYKE